MKTARILFRILGMALLTALSLGTVSCRKEQPVTPDPILTLAKTDVLSGKGSQFVSVTAAGAWSLASDAAWVRFTPASGTGNSSDIILQYEANSGTTARTAEITLSCGGKKTIVSLRQNAPSEDPQPESHAVPSTNRRWMELPET